MKQQWRVSPWLNSIASLVFNLILHRSNLPHHLPMKQIPTNSCCIVKNHPCIYPIAIIRAIFFFENVSSNIRHGISSLGIKDKIESNSFPLDMEKTVRNFFPWSNLTNKQWKFVLFVVHVPRICRDIASIWRLFFSFIATAGTWETRANRKVAETPLFLRLAGNQRIFDRHVSTSSIRT